MRAKETLRLSTIRMVRAEILNKDKEGGEETSEKIFSNCSKVW